MPGMRGGHRSPSLPGRHVKRRPISDPGDELELGRKSQGRQETNFRPERRSPADPGDKFGDRPSEDFYVKGLHWFKYPVNSYVLQLRIAFIYGSTIAQLA